MEKVFLIFLINTEHVLCIFHFTQIYNLIPAVYEEIDLRSIFHSITLPCIFHAVHSGDPGVPVKDTQEIISFLLFV